MSQASTNSRLSPWPHRLALALALVTFPLIWVGGLVTTYDAGMAVPDWPGTYGYNLLLYPWQSWLAAPWDLFIEHGHRLLGSLAGMLATALVIASLRTRQERWLVWASVGALALVVFQGALGGARVLFDERLVALVHGCVGPLFLAYLAGLVVATSRFWETASPVESAAGARFARAAWTTVLLVFAQLVLGALLRHIPLTASVGLFRAALLLHLVLAAGLAFHVLVTPWRTRQLTNTAQGLSLASFLLPALVVVQLSLGLATYVAKYSFPAWLGEYQFAASYVVQEKSLFQSLVTTAHVAGGSLILFVAVFLAMRASRLSSGAGFQPAITAGWKPAPHGRAA